MSSFLSPLPPTTLDISVLLPDSGRCELAVQQRFVGRSDPGVAPLDQESSGSIPGGATRKPLGLQPAAFFLRPLATWRLGTCNQYSGSGESWFDPRRGTFGGRGANACGPSCCPSGSRAFAYAPASIPEAYKRFTSIHTSTPPGISPTHLLLTFLSRSFTGVLITSSGAAVAVPPLAEYDGDRQLRDARRRGLPWKET